MGSYTTKVDAGITFNAIGCSISSNKARQGGGIYASDIYGSTDGSYEWFYLKDITMINNTTWDVSSSSYLSLSITGSLIYFNNVRYALLEGTTYMCGVISFNNYDSSFWYPLFYFKANQTWENKYDNTVYKFYIYPRGLVDNVNYCFMLFEKESGRDEMSVSNGSYSGKYFAIHPNISYSWRMANSDMSTSAGWGGNYAIFCGKSE